MDCVVGQLRGECGKEMECGNSVLMAFDKVMWSVVLVRPIMSAIIIIIISELIVIVTHLIMIGCWN